MRAVLLVLLCIFGLPWWDPASCQESVYSERLYESNTHRVAVGNVWRPNRPATVALNRNEDECDVVMNLSANQRCEFVTNTSDCVSNEGFTNYPWITFCLFPPHLLTLVITLYVLWLFVLFLVLGLIASDFFCPNLSAISSTLGLTHNVAGVTFLAFGNGAPDVFSAMAAFSRPQTAGLAIGALLGAGIFVSTVVAGSVALVKPFTTASRPFLRDMIFYMAAVYWTFTILYKGYITLGETVGCLGLYIVYVLTVVVSAYIYNRKKQQLNGSVENSGGTEEESLPSDSPREYLSGSVQAHDEEYEPLLPYTLSTTQIFINAINPVDSRTWRQQHWSGKALKMIKVPVEVLLLLTVPVVDTDKEDHNWKRPLNCLHIITGPLLCVLTFQSGACVCTLFSMRVVYELYLLILMETTRGTEILPEYGLYLIQGELPVWVLTGCIGVFLSGIIFFTTTNEHPPAYHFLFSLLGFVVSAMWISTVASEIVSVLHLLGIVLSLSNTVLGLTLLAWGNSIGDYFADITMARQGYPRMAISACFGGIIFNMLFGVGLGCLLQMFHNNHVVMLEAEGMLCWVLCGALGLSLVFSFILVPLQCFHLSRVYGIFLLVFYFIFLVVALLTEFKMIQF